MTISIRLVETDGVHWVNLNLDGSELRRHGPFSTSDAAEDMAARLAAICRVLHAQVHMQAAAHTG